MIEKSFISDSEFYMWRAVFAFAFVDNVLSLEEQELLRSYLDKADFTDRQRAILKEDMADPPEVEGLYLKVTEPQHKKRFCVLARALAWCEGQVDQQEKEILKKVACFGEKQHSDYLHQSRGDAHIKTYYQEYAKSGMAGMMKIGPQLQMVA